MGIDSVILKKKGAVQKQTTPHLVDSTVLDHFGIKSVGFFFRAYPTSPRTRIEVTLIKVS